jgi:hypothetical protein
MISLDKIDELTGGRVGTFDRKCPLCSAFRHSPANRRAKVLRIWRIDPRFASYHCIHCGEKGYARDRSEPPPDAVKLAKARAEAAQRARLHKKDRLQKALWLWSQRRPIVGSIGERYLRERRGISCPLPATLGFLPARRGHSPAMIAAFGLAHEVEPGLIAIRGSAIRGVHLTRLLPNGSDRERGDRAKIMIGHSTGSPIVLAPPNDLLGLAITEGIEDALSAHQATGLGAWAAGCHSRLPALADAVPDYIDEVTVFAHEDLDGQRYAAELHRRLLVRLIESGLITLNQQVAA